jgi:hypothetical protein
MKGGGETMGNLERMRAIQAQAKAAKAEQDAEQQQPKQAPPSNGDKAKKPPKEKGPTIHYKCGHERTVKDLEHGFCPTCIRDNDRRRRQHRLQNRGMRRENKTLAFRFPVGTFFGNPTWDGEKWTGTLVVGGDPALTFTAENTAVEHLLRRLKDAYMQSLKNSVDTPKEKV